jgi:hypothetical protein
MTFASFLWLIVMQTGQFEGTQKDLGDVLRVVSGIFALILFLLSIYAWSRRKQPALVIVSVAFLTFFLKIIIELLSEVYDIGPLELFLIVIDFITLALFFMAIVLKPKRASEEGGEKKQQESSG